jgi:hypothetical protein
VPVGRKCQSRVTREEVFPVISCSIPSRKRQTAMPASNPVRMSWRALPVLTGDVRPDAFDGKFAGDVALVSTPGHLAWSPPI